MCYNTSIVACASLFQRNSSAHPIKKCEIFDSYFENVDIDSSGSDRSTLSMARSYRVCAGMHATAKGYAVFLPVCNIQPTLHDTTHRARHAASRFVQAMPPWSVTIRRGPSRRCMGAIVYIVKTATMHDSENTDSENTAPPQPSSQLSDYNTIGQV